jgi:hypothetical protein
MSQAPGSLSPHDPNLEEKCREIIEQAGYSFSGILPEFTSPLTGKQYEAQAMWTGPETGSTYALPLSELSVNQVREHTYAQDLKFRRGGL